jgi:hypothetical protein
MKNIKTFFAHKIFKVLIWVVFVLLGAFIILTIVRTFHYFDVQKINNQVLKIHSTKLTIEDVMGNNLPPDPGIEADKTIQGIDANNNGVRDDVELAIFKEYPKSAKTRAVLLQYALFLQLETKLNLNKEIATTMGEKESQSYDCIGKIVPVGVNDIEKIEAYRNFIENKQLNTSERKNLKIAYDNNTGSFELKSGCDIDLSKLLN